jgi:hypothetical protein
VAVLATDPFTGSGALSANWTQQNTDGTFTLVTNAAQPTSFGGDAANNYNAITWPDDQYSQAKVTVAGGTGDAGLGVACRMATGARTYYFAVVNKAASNNVSICKFVAGTFTLIASRTITWVDGDVLKLQVTGAGPVTLEVFQNGTQLGADISDSTSTIASGRAGIKHSSSTTSGFVDDWEGGSVDTAPFPPWPQRIYQRSL